MRSDDVLGNAPSPDARRTRVEYAAGHEDVATRIASRLGGEVRPLGPDSQAVAPDDAVAVVAGAASVVVSREPRPVVGRRPNDPVLVARLR